MNEQYYPQKDPQRNRLHILLIAVTTIATILISLYYLFSGSFIVFQNLFYIPIILSCIYYTMRGFIYSVCLVLLYMLLILIFTAESVIIVQALVRVALFIGIAGIVTFLSTRRKQAEEALREERNSLEQVVDKRTAELKESEGRLRDIIFSMADWVWEVDENYDGTGILDSMLSYTRV